jgi:hypothetical protein
VSSETTGDVSGLAAALARLGLPCDVESRARLAVLGTVPETARRLADTATRRDVIALARSHGFTHVAVELADASPVSGAPVLRD